MVKNILGVSAILDDKYRRFGEEYKKDFIRNMGYELGTHIVDSLNVVKETTLENPPYNKELRAEIIVFDISIFYKNINNLADIYNLNKRELETILFKGYL